jgi:hypothetical protein
LRLFGFTASNTPAPEIASVNNRAMTAGIASPAWIAPDATEYAVKRARCASGQRHTN